MKETSGEAYARQLVQKTKTNYETGLAFVTEKVAFNMRELIKQCRKNYWGTFDSPTDPATGQDKYWFHLTKQFVDFVVKNIDTDSKDINFRAKHAKAVGLTSLVRAYMRNVLDKARFGEKNDLMLRSLAINGTVVTNVEWDKKKEGLDIQIVDLLNFYIDATAESIAEAPAVIESFIVSREKFARLAKDWKNSDIEGAVNAERIPGAPRITVLPEITLYRYRGLANNTAFNGDQFDLTEVPVEIMVSCVQGTWVFHHISKRESNFDKGYEEAWCIRVPGRWYGEGIAERLIQYQKAYNESANIRMTRNRLTQLGLWVFRKGSGVTPQMLSRLAANGAIPVGDVDRDIKQLPVQDSSPSAYQDFDRLYAEAQRSTGAFDTAIGDSLPASTPATNAAIQSQASMTGFTLIREGWGMFQERLIQNRAMPLALSKIKLNDIIRMQCDEAQLTEIDEMMVYGVLAQQLEMINKAGLAVDPMQVEMMKQQALASLQQSGKQRFVQLLHTLNVSDYDVDVTITTEDFNAPVMVQNINTMIQVLGSLGLVDVVVELARQSADLMGIDASKIKMPQQPMGGPQVPGYNDAQSMNPATQPGGNPEAFGPAQGLLNTARTLEPNG